MPVIRDLTPFLAFGILMSLFKDVISWETKGESFMLFLPGYGTSDVHSTISIFGDQDTTITVETLAPELKVTGFIDDTGVFNLSLGPDHHVDLWSSEVTNKGVHVICNCTVYVNVMTSSEVFASGYNAIPDHAHIYSSFKAVTPCSDNNSCYSFIAIVGMINSLSINVKIRSKGVVTIDGTDYLDGDSLSTMVLKNGVRILKCKGDMSGTNIFTPFPTHVFSGSFCESGQCDLTLEQLPVSKSWGTEYSLTPFPVLTNGFYRLISSTSGTSVYSNGMGIATLNEGDVLDIDANEIKTIVSSSPIQIGMLITGDTNTNHSSAMILLQPSTENRKYYRVTALDEFSTYCQIEADPDFITDAWLNDEYMCDKTMNVIAENRTVVYIKVETGITTLAYSLSAYSLVVYGFDRGRAYGYAGIPGPTVSPPSVGCPPSGQTSTTMSIATDESRLASTESISPETVVSNVMISSDSMVVQYEYNNSNELSTKMSSATDDDVQTMEQTTDIISETHSINLQISEDLQSSTTSMNEVSETQRPLSFEFTLSSGIWSLDQTDVSTSVSSSSAIQSVIQQHTFHYEDQPSQESFYKILSTDQSYRSVYSQNPSMSSESEMLYIAPTSTTIHNHQLDIFPSNSESPLSDVSFANLIPPIASIPTVTPVDGTVGLHPSPYHLYELVSTAIPL